MVSASLAGCFGEEESEPVVAERTVWDFERPELTWYHFEDAVDAWGNNEFNFDDRNMPFIATGTYYGIGMSTFEPTMGITQTDTMVMSSYGNGPGGSTAVVSCDLIGMYDTLSYSCENVYDPLIPIVNSNDPYIYVDPWTGRIMKFDMHALLGMTVEWSDDDGESWDGPSVATQSTLFKTTKPSLAAICLLSPIRQLGCSVSTEMHLTRCVLQAKMVAQHGALKPQERPLHATLEAFLHT